MTNNTPYVAGNLVGILGIFKNNAGVLTDPTSITLKWGPVGNITTWVYGGAGSITRLSVGTYLGIVDTTPVGTVAAGGTAQDWLRQWVSTGTCQASCIDSFKILPLAA